MSFTQQYQDDLALGCVCDYDVPCKSHPRAVGPHDVCEYAGYCATTCDYYDGSVSFASEAFLQTALGSAADPIRFASDIAHDVLAAFAAHFAPALRTKIPAASWRVNVQPLDGEPYAAYFTDGDKARAFAEEVARNLRLDLINFFPVGQRASVTLWEERGVTYY